MENNFCDYLINIGLIDLNTSTNLKKLNHEVINSKKDHNFNDSFFISLMHYFNNLTEEEKKYMCFNLPLRYLQNKEKEKQQKIMTLLLKKEFKIKYLKLKYIFSWIKKTKLIKPSAPMSKETSGNSLVNYKLSFDEFASRNKKKEYKIKYRSNNVNINDLYDNQNVKNKMKIKKYNSYNANNYYNKKAKEIINNKEVLTTTDKKELLQLSECTFKPSINTSNNSFRNTNTNSEFHSTFEKLYKDSEKYKIKRNLKAMEIEHIINKELTFKPSLCVTPKSISNLKFENFQIRQQNFSLTSIYFCQ